MTAEYPWLGLTLQFMSFNYAFQRNVLNPMLARIERGYQRGQERGETLGEGHFKTRWRAITGGSIGLGVAASMAAAYVLAGMAPTALRELTYNLDQWQKHEDDGDLLEWIWDRAMSRSGLGGTIDPIVQVATNLKYDSDINKAIEGAGPNWYSTNAYNLLAPFLPGGPPTDSTNTRYHNAAKAFYNLVLVPFEAYAATRLLGAFGTVGRLAGFGALSYGTSPQAAEQAATKFAGLKGVPAPKDEEDTTPPEVKDVRKDIEQMRKDAGIPTKKELLGGEEPGADKGGPGAAGALPYGLMDDFIMPLSKVVSPMWRALPGVAKVGGLIAAGGAALYNLYNELEPYRGQEPPEKKQ
jgi:hypothetical protein